MGGVDGAAAVGSMRAQAGSHPVVQRMRTCTRALEGPTGSFRATTLGASACAASSGAAPSAGASCCAALPAAVSLRFGGPRGCAEVPPSARRPVWALPADEGAPPGPLTSAIPAPLVATHGDAWSAEKGPRAGAAPFSIASGAPCRSV